MHLLSMVNPIQAHDGYTANQNITKTSIAIIKKLEQFKVIYYYQYVCDCI